MLLKLKLITGLFRGLFFLFQSIFKAIKSDKSDSEQWPLHKLTLYVGVPAEKATKGVDTR